MAISVFFIIPMIIIFNMAESAASQHIHQSEPNNAFHYVNNVLYCENIPISQIERELAGHADTTNSTTPMYVYSRQQLTQNIKSYQDAIHQAKMGGRMRVFYAVKANANIHLMTLVQHFGCGAVCVSGYEVELALLAGFKADSILLNGNGKQMWEIHLAIQHGCMLNVDSVFDAENIVRAAHQLKKTARVLIRVNPQLERTPVHQYLATALKDSKFGVPLEQFDNVVQLLKEAELVQLIGLHCHIGSTIRDARLYSEVTRVLLEIRLKLLADGHPVKYLDVGGGLGIDYHHGTDGKNTPLSSKADLIRSVAAVLPPDVDLIIEPGRSLVATTGILVTRVLGTKGTDGGKQFVVVDAAMNDLIRPSFYQAYHHILPVFKKDGGKEEVYDIVGPVCESGDFLAQNRPLSTQPVKNDLIAVLDVGAYGMAMASNYNMRPRAVEVLVDGDSWKIIRRRENFNTLIQSMVDLN